MVTAQHVKDALRDAKLDSFKVNVSQLARWADAGKEGRILRHLQNRYGALAENPGLAQQIVRDLINAEGPARGSMKAGPVPRPKERAVHMGRKPSVEELVQKAAAADSSIGIHGVSVYVTDPSKWRAKDFGIADVLELRTAFPMYKTMGRGHYTVELPDPVTPEIAARFNRFFEWRTGGRKK